MSFQIDAVLVVRVEGLEPQVVDSFEGWATTPKGIMLTAESLRDQLDDTYSGDTTQAIVKNMSRLYNFFLIEHPNMECDVILET